MNLKPIQVRVRIPFCIGEGKYLSEPCVKGSLTDKENYMLALGRELESIAKELEEYRVESLYLCGISPSVMPPDLLGNFVLRARRLLNLSPSCEVSMNALPHTVCIPSLSGWKLGIFNKINLQAYSFDAEELRGIGCPHRPADIPSAAELLFKGKLPGFNIMLKYGLPGQDEQRWRESLRGCANLSAPYITLIPYQGGNEEASLALYAYACSFLRKLGYTQCSACHFSLDGSMGRYAKNHLSGMDYVGIGLGSISNYSGFCYRNTQDYGLYVEKSDDITACAEDVAPVDEACKENARRLYRLFLLEPLERHSVEALDEGFRSHVFFEEEESGLRLSIKGRYAYSRRFCNVL